MIPCYFDLDVCFRPLSLILRLPAAMIKIWEALDNKTILNLIKSCEYILFKDFNFNNESLFDISDVKQLFGGYSYLKRLFSISSLGDFVEISLPIIPRNIYYNRPCPDCRGTKIDQKYLESLGNEVACRTCDGRGLVMRENHNSVWLSTDHLCMLSGLAELFAYNYPEEMSTNLPMLMFLETGNGGYARQFVAGYYTDVFSEFLDYTFQDDCRLANRLEKKAKQLMWLVYNYSSYGYLPNHNYDGLDNSFALQLYRSEHYCEKANSIFAEVPGQNSCSVSTDLNPPPSSPFWKPGVKTHGLYSHNVDTPTQQLSLVAGLAFISGQARRWNKT